jgi:hypothetical protein
MQHQYKEIIADVATHYFGQPNHALSTPGKELRFGTHGSKSVDLIKGTWFDHEQSIGGGAADLIKHMEPDAQVVDRLEQFGLPKADKIERRETVFDYTDQDGVVRYQVIRIDDRTGKTYRQRRIDETTGQPAWGMAGVTALPYRLHELAASTQPVFICEGEKAADAVAKLGLIATTNHGGATKWWPSLTDWFRGRQVIILPDNDEPGEKHARTVADSLTGTAKSIRILRLPGLPKKGDVVDWLVCGGSRDQLTDLVKQTPLYDPLEAEPLEPITSSGDVVTQSAATQKKFELVRWGEVEEVKVKWLITDILPAQSFSVCFGRPGSYKSFLCMYLSAMIATGGEAFGKQVEQGSVVYVMGEGGAGLKPRLDALAKHYGMTNPPIYFLRSQLNLRSTQDDAIGLMAAINDAGIKPALVVIDTLSRSFGGGNENASEDMSAFINNVGMIQAELRTAVLVVHHSGKSELAGARGHSSLLGAVDAEFELSKDTSDDRDEIRQGKMHVSKMKDGEDNIDFFYRLDEVELSTLGIGKSSLVVIPTDAPTDGEARQRKAKPLTAQQQLASEALDKVMSDGTERVTSNHIPASAQCVKVSTWRNYFFQMLGEEDKDKRSKAFQRGRDAMLKQRSIHIWGDYVWKQD